MNVQNKNKKRHIPSLQGKRLSEESKLVPERSICSSSWDRIMSELIYFLTVVLIFRTFPQQSLLLDAQRGNSSRLDKRRQMRTGHLRRVCHTMHLSEMLSYFDGNIHCQFMRACRLHCWLRNVGIKRAVLTDSCTAVAFLTCHTRTRACWRL